MVVVLKNVLISKKKISLHCSVFGVKLGGDVLTASTVRLLWIVVLCQNVHNAVGGFAKTLYVVHTTQLAGVANMAKNKGALWPGQRGCLGLFF